MYSFKCGVPSDSHDHVWQTPKMGMAREIQSKQHRAQFVHTMYLLPAKGVCSCIAVHLTIAGWIGVTPDKGFRYIYTSICTCPTCRTNRDQTVYKHYHHSFICAVCVYGSK